MATLTLYMKSGNQIVLKRVKEWEVKWNHAAEKVSFLSIRQRSSWFFDTPRLIMSALDLNQIEAIVESD